MSPFADRTAYRWDPWIILAVALVVRLVLCAWAYDVFPPAADGSYYEVLARRMAQGAGYTWAWEDGSVTYAAHYPVGFPALVAGIYWVFGPSPFAVMAAQGSLGALAAFAIHRVVDAGVGARAARFAGWLVALHPGLILYTPAFMTEGLIASLLALALWAFMTARRRARRRWLAIVLLGILLGFSTLVRPQSIVLAPLLGALLAGPGFGRRLRGTLICLGVAMLPVLPWTLRNCQRMDRCALVSCNGGFNLLIGTDPDARGGWAPVKVPSACREVFQEASKDACFAREALHDIRRRPWAWLSLVPAKVSQTFDYAGAGPWYLHLSNPVAFPKNAKWVAAAVETAFERIVLLLAILGGQRRVVPKLPRVGRALGGVGMLFLLTPYASVALICLCALLWLAWRYQRLPTSIEPAVLGIVTCTALTHAVFFGAGRYSLVLFPLFCALAAGSSGPRAEPNKVAHVGKKLTGSCF